MRKDVGRGNVLYVHVTLLPALAATGELKTKPTQHSVKELRGIGISPDVIIARSDLPVGDDLREKIALFCDVDADAVIPAATADTIYEVPLQFEDWGLGDLVVDHLGLTERARPADLGAWRALVERIKRPKPHLEIALVGKYIELPGRVPLGDRGARPCRLGRGPRRHRSLGRLRGAHGRRCRREAVGRGRHPRARRVRPSRDRGQGARGSVRAAAWRPVSRAVPRSPVWRHRVRARRHRRAGRELDRVRPVHDRARSSTTCPTSATSRRRAGRCAWACTRRG